MVKMMCKTIAALLPCVAVTIFIVNGCADKRKFETKTAALDERVVVTTVATETDSQTIDDEDTTPPCIDAKEMGLKCKRNANGLLECLDASNFRMLAKGVPEKKRDTWYRFFAGDNDSCLRYVGFKDKNWVTRYEVRNNFIFGLATYMFDDLTIADGYYHTKTGKKFGKDSVLYALDQEGCIPNCENEGFIVFKDRKRDRQGMFNRNGDVAIPAEYNELTNVQNGMVIARKGAVRKRDDGLNLKDCGENGDYEHCDWVGGTWLLIDTLNNVLIEDLGSTDSSDALNLFSVKKTEKPHPDTAIRRSFPAKNGGYYSFISYDKELMSWLKNDLLKNLTVEKLIIATYDSIHYYNSSFGRFETSGNKRSFVTDNFKSLKKALMDILNHELEIDIFTGMLYGGAYYHFIFGSEKYYDNCGRIKYWIYPTMSIYIEYKDYKSNKFTFLRTDNGYKLIGVEIENDDNF
jgi:hypothetical protein